MSPHTNGMGRPLAPLKPDNVDMALDYLRRALLRRARAFSKPHPAVRLAYIDLLNEQATTKAGEWPNAVGAWIGEHMTPKGRAAMLTALRQRKAARGKGRGSRTVRVRGETYADLARLSANLGVSGPTVLRHLCMQHLATSSCRTWSSSWRRLGKCGPVGTVSGKRSVRTSPLKLLLPRHLAWPAAAYAAQVSRSVEHLVA